MAIAPEHGEQQARQDRESMKAAAFARRSPAEATPPFVPGESEEMSQAAAASTRTRHGLALFRRDWTPPRSRVNRRRRRAVEAAPAKRRGPQDAHDDVALVKRGKAGNRKSILKEKVSRARGFRTIKKLRLALLGFRQPYDRQWQIVGSGQGKAESRSRQGGMNGRATLSKKS